MALVVTPSSATATAYTSRGAALAAAALDERGQTFVALDDGDVQDRLIATGATLIDGWLVANGVLGALVDADQALQMPRTGTLYSSTVIAAPLAKANQQMAFWLADKRSLGEIGVPIADSSNIKEDTVGPITTVFFDRRSMAEDLASTVPAHVAQYLMAFVRSSVGAGYGAAVLTRGS